MGELEFTKVEGLGNDFLLLDRQQASIEAVVAELEALRPRAPTLCDRRRGVGADGILLVGPPQSPKAAATMLVINHDGSRPEMCGNGIRCVALVVAQATGQEHLVIDSDSGPKACVVLERDADAGRVRVDMGVASDLGDREPASGRGHRFRAIDMGNPHAVAFVDGDPEALCRELGPGVEVDPAFPDRTNVELVRRDPDGTLTLWVWERGCGVTQACGTGACATAAAAVMLGHAAASTPLRVVLPGGLLEIVIPTDPGHGVSMTGPARIAFRGRVR